jgi:Fur family ferric uptake transcriptional regulator
VVIIFFVEEVSWPEHASRGLRTSGFANGGARRIVVDFLGAQDCCLSAQEIHESVLARGDRIGIASVYRALETLEGLHLVHRVDIGDGVARFEKTLPQGDHHHHLVCDDCGKVEPFADPTLERALTRVAGRHGYAMDAHDVVLRGACSDCRAA